MKWHFHLGIKHHKSATKQFELEGTGRYKKKHKEMRIKKGSKKKKKKGSSSNCLLCKERQIKKASVLRIFIEGSISMTTEYLVILIAGETKHLKSQEICSRHTK